MSQDVRLDKPCSDLGIPPLAPDVRDSRLAARSGQQKWRTSARNNHSPQQSCTHADSSPRLRGATRTCSVDVDFCRHFRHQNLGGEKFCRAGKRTALQVRRLKSDLEATGAIGGCKRVGDHTARPGAVIHFGALSNTQKLKCWTPWSYDRDSLRVEPRGLDGVQRRAASLSLDIRWPVFRQSDVKVRECAIVCPYKANCPWGTESRARR